MSKSTERATEAARAIYQAGDKVTSEAIDAWLRARDGVGCSMRRILIYLPRAEPEPCQRQPLLAARDAPTTAPWQPLS